MINVSSLEGQFVFMHLGKTAGTTVKSVVKSLKEHGEVTPFVTGHKISLQTVLERFPNAKLSITLRDPLERIISGFNSRLRQGRPIYDRMWTAREAAAFSLFNNVEDYFRACISTREFDISAARFTTRAVSQVSNGYARLFADALTVRSHITRFYCIGHISNMQQTLSGIFSPLAVDPAYYENVAPMHVSGASSISVLNKFSPHEILALKTYFDAEYQIYNEFIRHVSVSIAKTY